ncbi:hypothetical protein [Streptomyces sp. NPDC056291]|uniref:hypothetical protein n=1 Tax=Streptomyces sp. NPDC056291 TaxID=3345772 RepID=UPI0035DD89BB
MALIVRRHGQQGGQELHSNAEEHRRATQERAWAGGRKWLPWRLEADAGRGGALLQGHRW